MANTILTVLCCTLFFFFNILVFTFIIHSVSDLVENRKRAKREADRETREREYHEKRMQSYK